VSKDREALNAAIAEVRTRLAVSAQQLEDDLERMPPKQRGTMKGHWVRMRYARDTQAHVHRLYADATGETTRERCRWVVKRLAEGPRPPGVKPLSLRRVQEIITGK
jgi:hypothetical protein